MVTSPPVLLDRQHLRYGCMMYDTYERYTAAVDALSHGRVACHLLPRWFPGMVTLPLHVCANSLLLWAYAY